MSTTIRKCCAPSRDLRRQFQADYRIVSASSGQDALEATLELKKRGENIALFLVDQRMPEMTGVEFLTQARELFPDSRRVLLTAYATPPPPSTRLIRCV